MDLFNKKGSLAIFVLLIPPLDRSLASSGAIFYPKCCLASRTGPQKLSEKDKEHKKQAFQLDL